MDVHALGANVGGTDPPLSQLGAAPAAIGAADAPVPIPPLAAGDAPAATPAVERADLENLPLAIKFAPSSPPLDALRAANFDRLA